VFVSSEAFLLNEPFCAESRNHDTTVPVEVGGRQQHTVEDALFDICSAFRLRVETHLKRVLLQGTAYQLCGASGAYHQVHFKMYTRTYYNYHLYSQRSPHDRQALEDHLAS
jgi:hypothetical protein